MRKARDAGARFVIDAVTTKNRLDLPKEPKHFITCAEFGAMVDLPQWTVSRAIAPYVGRKIGGAWYIDLERLNEAIALAERYKEKIRHEE